jgi:hypothetical protein
MLWMRWTHCSTAASLVAGRHIPRGIHDRAKLLRTRAVHFVVHHASSKQTCGTQADQGHAYQNAELQGDRPIIQKFHDGFSEGTARDAPSKNSFSYRQTIESSLPR